MQETIALEVGVSISTVKRSIHQLEKIGLIEVTRKKSSDKKRNKYKLHKFSEIPKIRLFSEGYKLSNNEGWFWSSIKSVEKNQIKPLMNPSYNNYEFEDDGCPF